MKIVTVSREFGSGGREVGKRLADALGFAYYDREIITELAERCSMDEHYVEQLVENQSIRPYPVTFARTFTAIPMFSVNHATNLLIQQGKLIRELAGKGNCVIVGRGADNILKEWKPFRLFIYADMPSKVSRCRARAAEGENLTDRELERRIKQVDKVRADTYSLIASVNWGDPHNYDLCINTTNAEIKRLIPLISAYAKVQLEVSDE